MLMRDPRDLLFWNLENIIQYHLKILDIERGGLASKEATTTSQYFRFFALVG